MDLVIIAVVAAILAVAGRYLYKAKKRGVKCVGCTSGGCSCCGCGCQDK